MHSLNRSVILSGSLLLSLLAGYAFAKVEDTALVYTGSFMVIQETPYGGASDGIQFFGLQRIQSKEPDRAMCSVDSDLPLAKAFKAVQGERVRITIEKVELKELVR